MIGISALALAEHPGLPESRQADQGEEAQETQRESEDKPRQRITSAPPTSNNLTNNHRNETGSVPDHRSGNYLFWGEPLAQWIMAAFSIVSTFVAVFAVCLLWATLREARKTTRAAIKSVVQARRANKAADETTAIARREFVARFKPWIIVNVEGPFIIDQNNLNQFEEGETGRPINVQGRLIVQNIGDMPATIEAVWFYVAGEPDWPCVFSPDDALEAFYVLNKGETVWIDKHSRTFYPNGTAFGSAIVGTIKLTPENRESVMMNPPPIIGRIIYSDPAGRRYEHHFAFKAAPTWGRNFVRFGGREYNYDREAD